MDSLGDLHGLVVHQHDVRRLDGRVAAHGAHGDADVRPAQHRCVVDAVAHKGQLGLAGLAGEQLLHLRHLVPGQQLAVHLVHAQLRRHRVCHLFGVAGEHDGLLHARLMQRGDGRLGVGLHHVGDHDVPRVLPIHRHVDDGPHAVAVVVGDTQLDHQLAVAGGHRVAVHHGGDAVAADLPDIRHALPVDGLAVGALEALTDGMGGGALRQRRVLQQLALVHVAVVYRRHLEHALGQRAGLVEYHRLYLGQRLQIVGALDEDALMAGAADTGEEAQGNADHQRARAAGHQERQRTVYPLLPLAVHAAHQPDHRRQDRQRQRAVAHHRRVNAGELGDEILAAGFAGAGVLHQLQYLGHRGLAKGLRGPDLQHAGHVDAAADDLVALPGVPGQALAGQGAGVQGGAALGDDAVDGHLLARLHHNDGADGHLVRVHLHQLTVLLDVGVVRTDVHQRADVLPALAHRVALEQLADLIEQHHGDGLVVVAAFLIDGQRERTHRGHRHQEVLVEHPPVGDALSGLLQNVVADDQIRCQIQRQPQPPCHRDDVQRGQHHRRDEYAYEHFLLFFRHSVSPFLYPPRRPARRR